jgi:membrane protein
MLQGITGGGPIDPQHLFERFLPPHAVGATDPFGTVEAILGRITTVGRSLSLVAVPAFLWFSTRLFASIRTALNNIYDVSVRPPKGHFVVRLLLAKLRDLGMVFMTLVLFLANTVLTTGLVLLQSYSSARGNGDGVILSALERWAVEVLGFGFLIGLFFLLYRHASVRTPRWQAALVAALFMAAAFEVAKRLFALYLIRAAGWGAAGADAQAGAVILFVVWLYYSALVFLLGGVVAETWELRTLQRSQRGID